MKTWIQSKLDPFESMWLNYKKLNVQSFETRTTSVSEPMHSSMKKSDDGYISNRTTYSAIEHMLKKLK